MLTSHPPELPSAANARPGHAPQPDGELALILDHAVVKDRLTLLHQEVDAALADLSGRTGADIAGIPDEMALRLSRLTLAHKAELPTPRQQALYDEMTAELVIQTRQRADDLRARKILLFRAEVVARQNAELTVRAVSDENIFDDSLQTKYRDLILLNLEAVHRSLPPDERRERLDAAARDFYRAVLDRRLARLPESAAAMLGCPAVRRALGPDESVEYDNKIAAAEAARVRDRTARDWVASGLPPAAARERAARHGENGPELLAAYRRLSADRNAQTALGHFLAVRDAWAAATNAGSAESAAPDNPALANPALAATVNTLLDDKAANGGQPPEPDYALFLRHMTDAPGRRAAAGLADETAAHEFVRSLGGVDGWAFACAARKIAAASTPADRALVADLLFAESEYGRLVERKNEERESNVQTDKSEENTAAGNMAPDGNAVEAEAAERKKEKTPKPSDFAGLNDFLAAVNRDRRVRLACLGRTELLGSEITEIVRARANLVNPKTPLASGE